MSHRLARSLWTRTTTTPITLNQAVPAARPPVATDPAFSCHQEKPAGRIRRRKAYAYLRRDCTIDQFTTEQTLRAVAQSQGLDLARTLVEGDDGAAVQQLLALIRHPVHGPRGPVVIVPSPADLCYGMLLDIISAYADVITVASDGSVVGQADSNPPERHTNLSGRAASADSASNRLTHLESSVPA